MPDDLIPQPPQNSLQSRPTSPELSPTLERLLTAEPNADAAIQEIAATPALAREARAVVDRLEAFAKASAGKSGVREIIGKRFALFPQPERSDGEWSAWWDEYHAALADVPYAALEAAMGAYVRQPGAEFMAKPGELLNLARTLPARGIQAYTRVRAALNIVEAGPRPPANPAYAIAAPQMVRPRTPSTPEDRERVKRWAADYRAQVEARPRKTIPLGPPCHGATDAGAITPSLRQVVTAQRGGDIGPRWKPSNDEPEGEHMARREA